MSKRFGIGIGAGACAVLAASSVAWACTYQPTTAISQDRGPAGSQVTVSGSLVYTARQTLAAPTQVSVHWNDRNGPTIGVANVTPRNGGYVYSLPVTVPAAAPGVYVISVSSGSGDSAHPFELTAAGAAAPAAVQAPATPIRTGLGDTSGSGLNGTALAIGIGLVSVSVLLLGAFAVTTRRRRTASGS